MSKSVLQWMEYYIRRAFRSRAWKKFMQVMVCVVVFCTTYALILPALTMEHQYACGIEEHLHGEACYEMRAQIELACTPESLGLHVHSDSCGDGSLCGYRAIPVHTHDEICYDAGGSLVCTMAELAEHAHADGCYEAGPLVCTLEKIQGHTHSEACHEAGPLVCSLEEIQGHAHSETCYDENGALVCTLEEVQGHTHDSNCFGPAVLTCTLEEQAGHTHEAACFGPAVLTCTREAVELHTHTETCLDEGGTLVCGLLQTAAHQHDESCVSVISEEKILACGVEEHVHASNCNSDPEADVEAPEQWVAGLSQVELTGRWADDLLAVAKSQLGYQESQLNFLMEDGARKGYTRYGHWFGITYADWDAMFVSFCLHHAGVPEEAIAGSAYSDVWMQELQSLNLTASLDERIPAAGEIVFFRAEDDSIRSGIINAVDTEFDETGASRIAQLRVIAGNFDNRVTEVPVAAAKIVTVASMEQAVLRYETVFTEMPSELPTEPAATVTQQAETESYIVTVAYSADLVLPEGAELRVSEYARDSDVFRQRCEEAGYELEWLLNIGFFLEDTELELDGAFDVRVTSKQGGALGHDITHFADEGTEQLEAVSVEEDGQSSVLFSADGFSDFGGGVAVAADTPVVFAAGDPSGYTFTTVNPGQLQEGVDYAIYYHNGGTQVFLGSGLNAISVFSDMWSSPTNIGGSWTVHSKHLGNNIGGFTWRIVKQGDGTYRLYSPQRNQYLHIDYNAVRLTNETKLYKNDHINGAASIIHHPWGADGSFLRYYNSRWVGTTARNAATTIYFAEVTPNYFTPPSGSNHPHAVHTGEVNINRLRFFNLCDGENGVQALPGCVFEVVGDNGKRYTLTSGNEILLELPADIPDGNYTITEISAPKVGNKEYMTDVNPVRTFSIKNGTFVGGSSIGTFINHYIGSLTAGKSAEVEDYANRIYEVMLNASAFANKYVMDPIDVRLVVDQSNSMLFPSGLTSTGKSVKLGINDGENDDRMMALGLDPNKVHYIISDPHGTSTVWAVWHDGTTWMYQDASYYAKAKHGNVEGYRTPDEQAIFPSNASYANQSKTPTQSGFKTARANGGALDKDMTGSGLGTFLSDNSNSYTFEIYTANSEFNRLHYLEEALGYLVCELADANPRNRVSLTLFTKTVNHSECVESTELTPEAVTKLLDKVDSVNTSGGTRQDIALDHVFNESEHNPAPGYDSYTVLITDGAPVTSGDQDSLGNAYEDNNIDENSAQVYPRIRAEAKRIREEENSTLMTVALAMDDVDGGAHVLADIATDGYAYAYSDASGLIEALQELVYQSLRPSVRETVVGDVVDEISDSFYPIAWVDNGQGAAYGARLLVDAADKDWILLQEGDWITLDGKLTQAGAADAAGQILHKAEGSTDTYYVQWKNQYFSDPAFRQVEQIAWVNAGTGGSTGRTVVGSDGTRDWILLNDGDWISQQGAYYQGTPSYWSRRSYGQYDAAADSIEWGSDAHGNNRQYFDSDYGWNGKLYLKAKEDFIGGNVIDTNKSAEVSSGGKSKILPVPTVNVRLLDMNQMNTEVTVYLGDWINAADSSPLDSLKYFFENTVFSKLVAGTGDVLNAYDSAEGLHAATFDLPYAMGENGQPRPLAEAEWARLTGLDGREPGPVIVEYTYDNASSHGPVGYFTFTLEKNSRNTEYPADYNTHSAQHACQPGGHPLSENCDSPAESYTLHVTYTAYKMGEAYKSGGELRPDENQSNGPAGPGTEVGGINAGDSLPSGKGVVDKTNIHEVHVISGEIIIEKYFARDYTAETDHTFTFTLHRTDSDDIAFADVARTITIPAGANSGSASITFGSLPRGTYTVSEALDDTYTLDSITVTDDTNCFSTPAIGESAKDLIFVMGNNVGNQNVIGKALDTDLYTSYIDPVNGVRGKAVFTNKEIVFEGEIPVTKVWTNGMESHDSDEVYVALYQHNQLVKDADGVARVLRLNKDNNWSAAFTVVLPGKDSLPADQGYSVREVAGVRMSVPAEEADDYQAAILENAASEGDAKTVIYYEKALENDDLTAIGGRAYIVQYTPGEDGAWTVTNIRAVEIPETGGIGTHQYTISGTLLIAAALVYGYSQRRKRGRRGSE